MEVLATKIETLDQLEALCMVEVADRIQQDYRLEDILRAIAYSTAWIAVELQKMREEK